jgi:hypothetical protein
MSTKVRIMSLVDTLEIQSDSAFIPESAGNSGICVFAIRVARRATFAEAPLADETT